jgi:uncharacterized protein
MLVALLTIAVLWLAAHALWIEPRRLVVRELGLGPASWHAPPLRIAVVGDLHAARPHVGADRLRRIVRRVQAESPDLVVLLGDFVSSRSLDLGRLSPEEVAEALAPLEAPLGVFAVLGNHDWDVGAERVRRALEGIGITVLEDEAVRVEDRGRALWIAGLRDLTRNPDVHGTLARVDDDAPVIVLSHSPDVFPEVPARAALTLAGHTHGGQISLPWLGPLVTCSRYGRRYVRGHVVEDGRHLFVTSGIGQSLLPIRLGVPPEIAILTLAPAAGKKEARRSRAEQRGGEPSLVR